MSDKRTVSTDALETLGMIHPHQQYRDAIHLAVEPVIAGERLSPGEHIFLRDGKAWGNTGATNAPPLLGIVDPFLEDKLQPGQPFWLVIYPRKITSLRHVWSHPELADEAGAPPVKADSSKAASEAWLRNWCDHNDVPNYETIMDGIVGKMTKDEDYGYVGVSHKGEYLLSIGSDAHCDIPPEFWDHVEIVTGRVFERAEHFSCSC